VDADLDTLATALYVKIEELLQQAPQGRVAQVGVTTSAVGALLRDL
jgi:hypothetical protein